MEGLLLAIAAATVMSAIGSVCQWFKEKSNENGIAKLETRVDRCEKQLGLKSPKWETLSDIKNEFAIFNLIDQIEKVERVLPFYQEDEVKR